MAVNTGKHVNGYAAVFAYMFIDVTVDIKFSGVVKWTKTVQKGYMVKLY